MNCKNVKIRVSEMSFVSVKNKHLLLLFKAPIVVFQSTTIVQQHVYSFKRPNSTPNILKRNFCCQSGKKQVQSRFVQIGLSQKQMHLHLFTQRILVFKACISV